MLSLQPSQAMWLEKKKQCLAEADPRAQLLS